MDAALDNVVAGLSVEGCQGVVQNAECTLLVKALLPRGGDDVVNVVGDAGGGDIVAVASCVAVGLDVVVDNSALVVAVAAAAAAVAAAAVVFGGSVKHGRVGGTSQRTVSAPAFGTRNRQDQPRYREVPFAASRRFPCRHVQAGVIYTRIICGIICGLVATGHEILPCPNH